MSAKPITPIFGEMAGNVSFGLGPGRSSCIFTFLNMIQEGTARDVADTLKSIARFMETGEPTRKDKEIILDATKAADWRKIGVLTEKAEEFARIIRQERGIPEERTRPAGFGQEATHRTGRRRAPGWG